MVTYASSGTNNFQPSLADLVYDAYASIGIRGPALTTEHMVDARRSLNFILQDWSGNRGVNLFAVQLEYVPLVPGQTLYYLPSSWINVLDVYIRQYQMATTASVTIGQQITATVLPDGTPMLNPLGEVMAYPPLGGYFTVTAGNPIITMTWPNHGQVPGNAFSFLTPVTAGTITLQPTNAYTVQQVIDVNTFTFNANQIPTQSENLVGGTPLFASLNASSTLTVYLINHGYQVGQTFTVQVATTVGGITLPAGSTYTILTVPNAYSFTISQSVAATSTTVQFENNGQASIIGMQANTQPVDIIMYGISRTEYASIPNKNQQGRPTVFWLDRKVIPELSVWLVPPTPANGGSVQQPYALGIYVMRQIFDANPQSGQVADMPQRFQPILRAELVAALAEKYRPELWQAKVQVASAMWQRAALDDRELTPIYIAPSINSYYT